MFCNIHFSSQFSIKQLVCFFIFLFTFSIVKAQDFGGEKVSLGNFARRLYSSQPFNGVKLLQTQDGIDYMISVVELSKASNQPENIQSRIASIKAKAYASQYVNGSNINSEIIIISNEVKTRDSIVRKTNIQEIFTEVSMGFIEGMELLINFEDNEKKQIIYVFYRKIGKK